MTLLVTSSRRRPHGARSSVTNMEVGGLYIHRAMRPNNHLARIALNCLLYRLRSDLQQPMISNLPSGSAVT
jgi:hypothetical protein